MIAPLASCDSNDRPRRRLVQHAGEVDVEVLDFDLTAAFTKCSGKDFSEAAGPFPN